MVLSFIDFDFVIQNLKRQKKIFGFDFGKVCSAHRNKIFVVISKFYYKINPLNLFCILYLDLVKKWKIVFLTCCFDSVLIGIRSECNRLSCEHEKHSPEFEVYYYKVNNWYFYCLDQKQLGQYWQCVIKDKDTFCPDRCEKCSICKEMTDVFTELQDSFFFYSKQSFTKMMIQFHINQFCGVYLIVWLIKK